MAEPKERTGRAVRFRPAGAGDVDAVVALVESAYRGPASRDGWTTEADLLDGRRTDAGIVAGLVAGPAGLVLVGEEADRIVVCAHVERRDPVAYFGMFAVVPGRQGSGLGAAALAEAERIAGERWHLPTMEMTVVRQRHDLVAWYERKGYRLTGETRPFPYGDERYGVPRRPDLAFAVLVKGLAAP